MNKIAWIMITLIGCFTASIQAQPLSFKSKNLLDTSESNYLEFLGMDPTTSNAFEKIVADFNGDGHDDILSLGGDVITSEVIGVPTIVTKPMELMLYKEGEYIYQPLNLLKAAGLQTNVSTNASNIVDIDNDNDLDIVLKNGQIGLNDGLANFTLINYSNKNNFKYIFTVDWDNDNDLDIVTNSDIFINNGTLDFTKHETQMALEDLLFKVLDINNDKIPDLLVVDNHLLKTWINDGKGQLKSSSQIKIEGTIHEILELDFNNDNFLDLLLSFQVDANTTSSDVMIKLYQNDGSGNFILTTFELPEIYELNDTKVFKTKLLSQDLDNDGDLDLLISAAFTNEKSNCSYDQFQILIYENIDYGWLEHTKTLHSIGYNNEDDIRSSSDSSSLPTLIDLNKDGWLDVVVGGEKPIAWIQTQELGQMSFRLSNASSLKFNHHIDTADIDGDGNLDIYSTAFYNQTCQPIEYSPNVISTTLNTVEGLIWVGNGDGSFQAFNKSSNHFSDIFAPQAFVRFADLENTGKTNLIYNTPKTQSYAKSTVNQNLFSNGQDLIISLPEPAKYFEVKDIITGDNKEVVMIADTADAPILVYSYSHSLFTEMARLDFGAVDGELKLADMDNDGNVDIIANSKHKYNSITIWYNNGDWSFTAMPVVSNDVKSFAISDFNQDGLLDILSSNSLHELNLNHGNRTFSTKDYNIDFWFESSESNHIIENSIPENIQAIDINNDGKDDLIAQTDENINVYINASNYEISFYKIYSQKLIKDLNQNTANTSKLVFADYNNDGLVDIATAGNSFIKILSQTKVPINSGLYYDTNHSGHGFAIEELGKENLFYSLFFSYDEFGQPEWFAHLNRYQANEDFWALNRVSDDNLINFNYDYKTNSTLPNLDSNYLGWFNFTNSQGGESINDSIISIGNELHIWQTSEIVSSKQKPKYDLSGLWWAGSEDSGWGISVSIIDAEFGQTIVAILYFYDELGKPRWLIGQNDSFQRNQDINIKMKQIVGYGRSEKMIELNEFAAGTITLNLENASQNFASAGRVSMQIHYPGDENKELWNRNQLPIALFSKPRE
jgi:hypothetical protein